MIGSAFDASVRAALTIAGSDSGGGAGIQADLKSFAAIGVHGCSVVTCVTAQNMKGVTSIFPIPPREIRAQLRAVLSDIPVPAAKTGMLYSREIVRAVADELPSKGPKLVVDPVMVATVGASLRRGDLRDALVRHLLPRATLVTPNLFEASQLAGFEVDTPEAMRRAAKAIASDGAAAVLVKGGHMKEGGIVDLLYDGRYQEFRSVRFDKDLHGSGCTLAASITAYLALGKSLRSAVGLARQRVQAGFLGSYRIGRGVAVVDSGWTPDRYGVWVAVTAAAAELAAMLSVAWVPEVGINLACALPAAGTPEEVCALKGRIQRVGDAVAVTGHAEFGASKHVARVVLAAMRFDPSIRSAANLKYTEVNFRRLERTGLRMGTFDRSQQPEGTSTMDWGTTQAVRAAGRVPDVICDSGSVGKEGMIRVLGRSPKDVLRKVRRIVRA
jgi:hydroxymethylpyrimidine/phosphomethylpyrimidine kinase